MDDSEAFLFTKEGARRGTIFASKGKLNLKLSKD